MKKALKQLERAGARIMDGERIDEFVEYVGKPSRALGRRISVAKSAFYIGEDIISDLQERFQLPKKIFVRLFYNEGTEQIKIKFSPRKGAASLKKGTGPAYLVNSVGFRRRFRLGDEWNGRYKVMLDSYEEITFGLEDKE